MNKLKKSSPNKELMTAVMIAATLYQVGSSIANNKRRKDAEARANALDAELENQMQAMRDYDFRVQNPYEDVDVTTKAQEVAANQQTQQAADILARLAPIAGAGATASLATAIAKQGSVEASKLQGKMEQQEFQLQQRAAGAQLAIDRGVKQQEFNRDAALMNMQMYRAAGEYAQAAQYGQAAREDLRGAIKTGIKAAEGVDDLIDKDIEVKDETFNAAERGAFAGSAPTLAETFGTGEQVELDTQNTSYLYDDFPQFRIQQNTPQYQILPQQNYLTQQYELEEL